MTRLWNKIASRLGFGTERSEQFVALARLAILWERVWPALWPATAIIGLFLAAALFDLFADVSATAHVFVLLLAVLGTVSLLHRNLGRIVYPAWDEGARRVERDSGLAHRPITEGTDTLAAGADDPWTAELWRAHLARLLAGVTGLKLRWPSPQLGKRDPYGLRFAVLVLIAAGFSSAADADWGRRLGFALTPDTGATTSLASLEAWINPPAYTDEAPIYLEHGDTRMIAAPAGSELVLRVHGAADTPRLSLDPAPETPPRFAGTSGEFGADAKLARDGDIRVLADGRLLGHWRIKTIADLPPQIAFAEPPSATVHEALKIAFMAADDYGVTAARAIIRPVDAKSRVTLSVDLPLASASARTLSQTVYRDLTGEPLAGTDVEIVLEAQDGAGQTGRSKPMRVRLPAHVFTNPLARALIEQRQNLALAAPYAREKAALTLDALTLAPELFYADQPSAYLAIRSAYWGLENAHDAADIARVEQLLWDTAVALERGELLAAADELRRLQNLLTQALAQGAPQDVIDALLDRYRQALQHYLQSLAQNAPPQSGDSLSSNAKTISPADLDAMLKAIQQMAQTGARGAAAQALAMLQNLLENLHMANGGAGPGGGNTDKALSDAIQGLGDMIGRQRQLLDKSFRQGQGAGDPKDGGGKGLAQQQGKLRDDLDKLMKGLGANKAPKSLGDAGRNMGSAQNDLGANDFDNADQAQKNVLDALRDSAEALAQQMAKESGQNGAEGQASQNNDPLGRDEGTSGLGSGNGTKIPDRDALERARSILEELRRRAAERGRPKEELDYYDRLLKQF